MRLGFGLSVAFTLMLGGCIGTEVRNDPIRISSTDAGGFCRGLAGRSGTPDEAGCLRALGRDRQRSDQAEAARLRYAMGRVGSALAETAPDRGGVPVRCVEGTVDGTLVTTCR